MSTGTIRRKSTAINRGVAAGVRESNYLLSQVRAGPTPTPSSSSSNFTVTPDADNRILISNGTSPATAKTDAKLTWTGSGLNIEGDLLVTGSTNTSTSDTLIELNKGHTGPNNNDLGIIMERGTSGDNAFMGWDEQTDKFSLATTTATGASSGNLTLNSADLQIKTLYSENAVLSATLNVTGATSLATASGVVNIASTGVMTTVKGTLNVDEAVTIDTTLDVTGDTSVSTLDSTGATSLATGGGVVNIASTGVMTTVKGTLNVDEAVTIDTTITSGNAVASYGIGLKNSVSTSVAYSAANDIRSGAIHVPAGSLITDIHVIVSAQLTHGSGTTGVKAGTVADGEQIITADVDAIIGTASTTTAVGLGSSTNSATRAALGGNADLVIVVGQAYRSLNTEVHITVDNSAGNMSAGTVKFVVEYVKLA